ncbi:hypothetical protein [Peribacillus tepidiphilus]|uniref:hypothetical protein n=1 Tax=Peribacillus tepidiphilus TaxID=2652445 RepID=UPI0012920AB3|nr:hypothetical protein [Peribacillus tepidiphilus]
MMDTNALFEKTKDMVLDVANATGEFVPGVQTMVNFARFKRFNSRLLALEDQIREIFLSISKSDIEFFAEKVGTMVFEKIMNEQEDEKAEFLVLGFENCVKNDIKDTDLILYYFDLLTELRVMDLKRLVSLSGRTEARPIIAAFGSEEEMLIDASDTKLKRMGLIKARTNWSTDNGETIDVRSITISEKGNRFLDFIGF